MLPCYWSLWNYLFIFVLATPFPNEPLGSRKPAAIQTCDLDPWGRSLRLIIYRPAPGLQRAWSQICDKRYTLPTAWRFSRFSPTLGKCTKSEIGTYYVCVVLAVDGEYLFNYNNKISWLFIGFDNVLCNDCFLAYFCIFVLLKSSKNLCLKAEIEGEKVSPG